MAPRRSLPAIFWVLVAGALVVLIVLVAALITDNASRLKPVNKPVITATPTPSPDQIASSRAADAAQNAVKKCSFNLLKLSNEVKGAQLVSWTDEPYSVGLWVVRDHLALERWTMLNLKDDSANVEQSVQQSLVCKDHQAPECFYPRAGGERLSRLSMEDGFGIASLESTKDHRAALTHIDNSSLHFRQAIGVCGRSWDAKAGDIDVFAFGKDELQSLIVINRAASLIAEIPRGVLGPYSSMEAPLHPPRIWKVSPTGLLSISSSDCAKIVDENKPITLAKVIRDGDTLLLITEGKGSFGGDNQVWVLRKTASDLELAQHLDAGEIGFRPQDAMWTSDGHVMLASTDFFRTKTQLAIADLSAHAVKAVTDEKLWPGEGLLAREKKLGPRLEFLYADSRKSRGGFKIGGAEWTEIPGPFAPEEPPRFLVSERSPKKWLVIYQSMFDEPIHAGMLDCSN